VTGVQTCALPISGFSIARDEPRSQYHAVEDGGHCRPRLAGDRAGAGDESGDRKGAGAGAKRRMSKVFIISAPSGSGKSTLVNELRRAVAQLDFSISYTTRPPRGSEQNGREYYFVSRQEFERMLAADEFLEHADVFGHYYGTDRKSTRLNSSHGSSS